jgi:hypothetical protein
MKTAAWLLAAATIAVAAPASAATFVINLAGGGANVGGSTNGNVRTYNPAMVDGVSLSLTASAWTNALDMNPDSILSSYLGAYSSGLGVTNPNENGSNNTHVVDNVAREDFILLKFSRAVDLTSIYLNVFAVDGGTPDSDATVRYRNGATAPVNGGLSSSYFSQFTSIAVPGNSSSGSRTIDGVNYSDTWLVGAASGGSNDGFKLFSVTVNTAVPEPATWAMMLVGFGGLGATLRTRRRMTAVA